MQPPFYHLRTLIVCLLTVTIFLGSCKKTVQPAPTSITSISGIISPARAALQVVAVRDAQTYTTVPDENGKFLFQDLTSGTYNIYAVPDSNYIAPAGTVITLQSGQQVSIGTMTLSLKPVGTSTLLITCAPGKAAAAIRLTNKSSGVITSFQPVNTSTSSSGFNMVVPVGTYTVSVIPAADYQAPPDTSVTLVAGRTYAFPTITLLPVTYADAGQITGTIVPSGVVTRITISKINSALQYSVTPDASGRFSFASVAPGTYSLVGTVGIPSTYLAPTMTTIVVNSNQRVDLGTINLSPDTRKFYYYVNDTIYRNATVFTCTLNSSELKVTAPLGPLSGIVMRLTIDKFTGIGQYQCNTIPGASIVYSEPSNSPVAAYTVSNWSSNVSTGSGTITVTKYDPAAKKISGTFSGTLQPLPSNGVFNGGKSTKTVSKGVFTDMTYQ